MKKAVCSITLVVLFVLSGNNVFGQEELTPEQQQINAFIGHNSRAFQLAQRYGDANNAITAVYNVLAEYPQNDSLLYTLSYLYIQNGKYASAVLVAKDLLNINPNHEGALEISGAGYEKLGIKDKSLDAYESLYLKSNEYQTLYKVAFLQYDLKRYKECATNVDILLKKPESDTLKVYYADENEQEKEYSIKVALYNLKGLVSQAQGDNVNARKHFESALEIAPDFYISKQNMEGLNK